MRRILVLLAVLCSTHAAAQTDPTPRTYMQQQDPRALQTLLFKTAANETGLIGGQARCYWNTSDDCLKCYHTSSTAWECAGSVGAFWDRTSTTIHPTTITNSVGIGTTSASAPLHVSVSTSSTSYAGNVAETIRSQASGRAATLTMSDGTNQAMAVSYLNGGSAPRFGLGGSSEVLTILNSGNVGINTTAPAAKFQVVGTASPGDGIIIKGSASSAPENRLYDSSNNMIGRLCASQASADCTTTAAAGDFNLNSGGATIPIVFGPTIGEWGRFAATSGWFGVGTGAPGSNIEARTDTNGTTRIRATNNTNGTSAIVQVGAGSTSEGVGLNYVPAASTLLSGIADAGLLRTDSTVAGGLWLDAGGTTGLVLATNDAARLTVNSSGNVGIGDTSPAALLVVGSGDLFQVNSSGAIAAVVGITNTGAVNLGRGTVSQATNINTNVTLNAASGVITTQTATTAGATCESGFTVTNSMVASASVITLHAGVYSGTLMTNGYPDVKLTSVGSGSFAVTVCNTHAANALNGTIKIHFSVL